GDGQVILPGGGRLDAVFSQDVAAIVDHLEVAVQRDRVDLALVGRAEIAEEGRNVVPLQGGVGVDAGGEVLQVAGGHEVAHPLRVEGERLVGCWSGWQCG